jgi:hypothetical protein
MALVPAQSQAHGQSGRTTAVLLQHCWTAALAASRIYQVSDLSAT